MSATNLSDTNISSKEGLSVLQWNCNGLLAHQNEFKNHLAINRDKYDVICLQETFLKPEKNFAVSGYSIIRQDRKENNKGGVLTMVKENLKYVLCGSSESNSQIDSCIEYIQVDIKLSRSRIKIVNVYIPPDKEVGENNLNSFYGSQSLIIGDLNAKSTLWGSPQSDRRGLVLEELIDKHNATVINTGQATSQHHSGSVTHLDIAIVDSSIAAASNWSVLNNTIGSDHCPTVVTIHNRKLYVERDGPPRFKLSKADWRKFKILSNDTITAELVVYDDNINAINNSITEGIISAAERSIPTTKPGQYKTKYVPLPYWDETCKRAVYERNRARNKLKKKGTQENMQTYHRLKGQAQKIIKTAASEYWQSYCETLNRTSNLSAVWGMAKKMNGVVSQRKIPSIMYEGTVLETDQEKANIFAKNFAKISSDENYDTRFKLYKEQADQKFSDLKFARNVQVDEFANSLNDEFNLSELLRAVRETKNTPLLVRIRFHTKCYSISQNNLL